MERLFEHNLLVRPCFCVTAGCHTNTSLFGVIIQHFEKQVPVSPSLNNKRIGDEFASTSVTSFAETTGFT